MPAAHMALRGDVFFASLCFYEAEHGKDLVVLSGSCWVYNEWQNVAVGLPGKKKQRSGIVG